MIGLLLREALDRLCVRLNMYLVRSGTDFISLLFLSFFFICWGNRLRLRHFKSNRTVLRANTHRLKKSDLRFDVILSMTSFHAKKCCHLMSERTRSVCRTPMHVSQCRVATYGSIWWNIYIAVYSKFPAESVSKRIFKIG